MSPSIVPAPRGSSDTKLPSLLDSGYPTLQTKLFRRELRIVEQTDAVQRRLPEIDICGSILIACVPRAHIFPHISEVPAGTTMCLTLTRKGFGIAFPDPKDKQIINAAFFETSLRLSRLRPLVVAGVTIDEVLSVLNNPEGRNCIVTRRWW